MKPEASTTFAAGCRHLWWRRREGKCLTRSLSKAKRLQRCGRDAEMRTILTAAGFAVEAIQRDDAAFARDWRELLKYHLAVFDLREAEETVRRAERSNLSGAAGATEQVATIMSQTAGWGDALASAHSSMQDGWKPIPGDNSLLIFLPSTAMSFETAMQPGLCAGLRLIFGGILAVCQAEGIPFEVRGRLANHGIPPDETGRRYISHHTKSDRPGGLHIKVTDLPSCFSMDGRGYSGWSEFAQTPLEKLNLPEVDLGRAEEFIHAMRQRVIGGNVSKYRQSEADGTIKLPDTYVFLGLQVINDTVQALAHLPMLEMLAEVARTCRKRGVALVVKRHPRCNSVRVAKALADGVRHGWFQLSDASIHDLISRSRAVCVVNSSVGAEALLHGKPVYVFGESEYQHVCFRMRKQGDFEKEFELDRVPVSRDDLTRYLYLLRNEYAVDASDPQAARESIRRRVLRHVHRNFPNP